MTERNLFGNLTIEKKPWEILPKGRNLGTPGECLSCHPNFQTTLWRSFTSLSLSHFRKTSGQGKFPDFETLKRAKNDYFLIPKEKLDQPGVLWATKSPSFALGMGLTRALLEQGLVWLLGFNICSCDFESGLEVIDTNSYYDVYAIRKLNPRRLKDSFFFSSGLVINHLNLKHLKECVAYQISTFFLREIKASLPQEVSTSYEMKLYKLISSMLRDLAVKDPRISDPWVSDTTLARTWRLFLQPTSNPFFSLKTA